jgi:hypothetical protein
VVNDSEHLHDEEISAFLDSGLSPADRARVAAHLAACDDCRVLLGPPQPQSARVAAPRTFWKPAVVAVAAAVVLVAVSLRSRQHSVGVDRIRTEPVSAVESPQLAARGPREGADVLVDTLVLRWVSAGPNATYAVSIVDDSGVVVWEARVDSIDVTPPRDIMAALRPGTTYYWRADALLPDLRTASTGPQGFIPVTK